MSYMTKHSLLGEDYYFQWPMSEYIIDIHGNHYQCRRWPDRLSDCRINGKKVDQITYQRSKDAPLKRDKKAVRRG